ncbi:hypothetical protein SCB71_06305 [Herbiconiux sp. KACC 21604]|uniref:hypothetical protein n=1 Tax=unclassified Herbiconiux TaxID=2618217 RepID=UPI0014930CDE|nr:hypothetical protein [Herbiconiux sp. SALV-R1]QJU52930.1 hypothetical protein HL652_04290 [Herbiconiux sp. SALV-R1]WPO87850.1 hypothetical protein SCB71_06305 [Herbiconiux sp. KACC 21604]
MVADVKGNDIGAVGVPVDGNIGFAPYGTPLLTPQQGASRSLTLSPAFVKIGLIKDDGGPQFSWEADGDPIEFWQEGYSIPSGLANVGLSITAAQALSDHVRRIISGVTPDQYGYLEHDGGGHDLRWVVFTEEIFKNGAIRRRQAPSVSLASAAEDQSTRGEVMGNALSFTIARHPAVGNKHFGEWVIPALDAADTKTTWNVTVSGTPTGGTFTLILNGFATAPLAYNANASAVTAALNALSGVTGITGITSTGTGPIVVTLPSAETLTAANSLTGGTNPDVVVA